MPLFNVHLLVIDQNTRQAVKSGCERIEAIDADTARLLIRRQYRQHIVNIRKVKLFTLSE